MRHTIDSHIPPGAKKLFRQIDRLGRSRNLAAAIVHLNDTYIIEERDPMPGMARVAGLIKEIREAVLLLCGEDRTLVVHSGDFLSPSLLAKRLKGEAMTDILNKLPLDLATLGNHEFDFKTDTLSRRLQQARFRIVLANLKPPKDYTGREFEEIFFWPENDPDIAFTGLMSEEVAKSAKALGFEYEPYYKALPRLLARIQEKKVGRLVVLSHFSQSDDRKLLKNLSAWRSGPEPELGDFLILGGHDHDIDWYEHRLSKNYSNCRSVSVFLVPLDSLAWGHWIKLKSLEDELSRKKSIGTIREMVRGQHPFWLNLELKYPGDLEKCLDHLPRRVVDAFSRRLCYMAELMKGTGWEHKATSGETGLALKDVFEFDSYSDDDYYDEVAFTGRYPLYAAAGDLNFQPDEEVSAAVEKWLSVGIPERSEAGVESLRDFSELAHYLEARDDALRVRSTDFGNLVVDCIRAGTGADVALVNAGAFRVDMQVSPKISSPLIEETFLFDGPEAIMLIEMTREELDLILRHSDKEPGHGRVLQRTLTFEDLTDTEGRLRVAIAAFLLCDDSDFDGYAEVLAKARCIDRPSLQQDMRDLQHRTAHRITDLIERNVHKVEYCNKERFSLKSVTQEERDILQVLSLVNQYRDACQQHGLHVDLWIPILYPLGDYRAEFAPKPLPPNVARTRSATLNWTKEGLLHSGAKYMYALVERLRSHPDWYRSRVPYHSYLSAAIGQLMMADARGDTPEGRDSVENDQSHP